MAINTNHVTNDISASSGNVTINGKAISTAVSQGVAEEGASPEVVGWTAQRVRQATKAYVDPILGDIQTALDTINGV